MITSTFGKIFLDAYNEKYGTQYDAKAFFVEKFFPLFFDHNKYMMWPQNSPFVQMSGKQKVWNLTNEERQEKLNTFIEKIESGSIDASIALGYAASEEKEFATTSGQVTSLNIKNDISALYLSWIGAGLAIGVKGGLSILFNNKDILLGTYEGWQIYRSMLNSNPSLGGNQISTWNGQWLSHIYDNNFDNNNPMDNFYPLDIKGDEMSIALLSWTKILSVIAKRHSQPKMLGYIFSFGQTNTTIGFIPFSLNPIRRTAQLYKQLFGDTEYTQAEELFGTAVGLKKSSQQGAIGIWALEPKGLKDYVTKGLIPKKNDVNDKIIFHTYITWILTMLNNQELWEEAQTIASALKAFADGGGISTKNKNAVNSVLESTNKRNFIENLTEIVKSTDDTETLIKAAKLVNDMPTDNVAYFLTLIRFQYATK